MKSITVKRAELLKEWLLAVHGNNESYYESTLLTGIPDGDDLETVLDDLQDGFYDDDIDEMLAMYAHARKRYGADGYYSNGRLFGNGLECLRVAGYVLPDKITKRGSYCILRKE